MVAELEPAVVQVLAVEQAVAEQVLADMSVVQVVLRKRVVDKLAVKVVEPVAQELARMLAVCRMLAEVGKPLQP